MFYDILSTAIKSMYVTYVKPYGTENNVTLCPFNIHKWIHCLLTEQDSFDITMLLRMTNYRMPCQMKLIYLNSNKHHTRSPQLRLHLTFYRGKPHLTHLPYSGRMVFAGSFFYMCMCVGEVRDATVWWIFVRRLYFRERFAYCHRTACSAFLPVLLPPWYVALVEEPPLRELWQSFVHPPKAT